MYATKQSVRNFQKGKWKNFLLFNIVISPLVLILFTIVYGANIIVISASFSIIFVIIMSYGISFICSRNTFSWIILGGILYVIIYFFYPIFGLLKIIFVEGQFPEEFYNLPFLWKHLKFDVGLTVISVLLSTLTITAISHRNIGR